MWNSRISGNSPYLRWMADKSRILLGVDSQLISFCLLLVASSMHCVYYSCAYYNCVYLQFPLDVVDPDDRLIDFVILLTQFHLQIVCLSMQHQYLAVKRFAQSHHVFKGYMMILGILPAVQMSCSTHWRNSGYMCNESRCEWFMISEIVLGIS